MAKDDITAADQMLHEQQRMADQARRQRRQELARIRDRVHYERQNGKRK
ncbi:hypothetical protein [Saccharomonospora viridis]|nr:hypothetical protein [Saccharomonospora viridis]